MSAIFTTPRRSLFLVVALATASSLTPAFGFTTPQLPSSERNVALMAKGRRGGLDIGGGSASKTQPMGIGGGNKNRGEAPSQPQGTWVPVSGAPTSKDLPKEKNKVTLVDTMAPSLMDGRTNPTGAVAIVNYEDQTFCFDSACASCKIPLTKSQVLEPTDETGGKDPRLQCDFCGATYNIRSGAPVEKAGGKLMGFLFSKQESSVLPTYGLGERDGKVFINIPK